MKKSLRSTSALWILMMVLFLLPSGICFAKSKPPTGGGIPDDVMHRIEEIVDAPSCFEGVDGMVRKSRKDRMKDMINWYKKYKNVNEFYNGYGLDINNFRNQDDFLDYNVLNAERNAIHHENLNPKDYRNYCRSKLEFYNIMEKSNPNKTPKIHYVVIKGEVVLPEKSDMSTQQAIESLDNGKYIFKLQHGKQGRGLYLMDKNNDEISFYSNYEKIDSLSEFLKLIHGKKYLIQEYVNQHQALKRLNPSSLNTLRVVTMRYNDDVHILTAILRLGLGKSIVDNASAGGTFVEVDKQKGTLKRYGCYMPEFKKKAEFIHPVSHIKYEGYKLPYWEEVINLVKKLHKETFYGLSSVGWDVAITEDGPIVIEANARYGIFQFANGGVKKDWYKLKNM